jgi:UDP-N-acetylglucosamine 2-epimerase
VDCDETQIVNGIQSVIAQEGAPSFQGIENPYGNPGASKRITDILETYDLETLLPKRFLDAN